MICKSPLSQKALHLGETQLYVNYAATEIGGYIHDDSPLEANPPEVAGKLSTSPSALEEWTRYCEDPGSVSLLADSDLVEKVTPVLSRIDKWKGILFEGPRKPWSPTGSLELRLLRVTGL